MRGLVWMLLGAIALTVGGPSRALAQPAEGDHGGDHAAHDLGHGDASENLESPAEFRSDLAVYTFAVFMLLLLMLGLLAWPKISAALEEREKRIEANIAAAEAKHDEAKRLLAEHEARLASAAGEVRALLEEARRDAEQAKADIIEEAQKAAKAERDRAVREIKIAADHALKNMAETSANMAVDLAGKVLRETINPAKQQELVRSALAKLNASNN